MLKIRYHGRRAPMAVRHRHCHTAIPICPFSLYALFHLCPFSSMPLPLYAPSLSDLIPLCPYPFMRLHLYAFPLIPLCPFPLGPYLPMPLYLYAFIPLRPFPSVAPFPLCPYPFTPCPFMPLSMYALSIYALIPLCPVPFCAHSFMPSSFYAPSPYPFIPFCRTFPFVPLSPYPFTVCHLRLLRLSIIVGGYYVKKFPESHSIHLRHFSDVVNQKSVGDKNCWHPLPGSLAPLPTSRWTSPAPPPCSFPGPTLPGPPPLPRNPENGKMKKLFLKA